MVRCVAVVAILLVACSKPAGPPTVTTTPKPVAIIATCGNGIVEPTEVCDPNVRWANQCAAPWGMCWQCASTCTTWMPVNSEPMDSVATDVFCTREGDGASARRTYDERGYLMTEVDEWPSAKAIAHHTFTRDAGGWIVGHDSDHIGEAGLAKSETRMELDAQHRRIRSWDLQRPSEEWHFAYATDGPLLRFWGGATTIAEPEVDRRYSYDREHRLISEVATFRGTPWHASTMHRYDALGRETDDVMSYAEEIAEPSVDCHTDYTASGSVRCCVSGAKAITSCWTKDTHGQLVRQSTSSAAGNSFITQSNVYDANGLLARTTVREEDGTLNRVEQLSYDRRGLLLTIARRAPHENRPAIVHTRTYDCLEAVFAAMPKRAFTERR